MKVFINNKEYKARENETIIELADRNGINIPRFCYHKHLSVVASCRMCLVEIENIEHAQPACSTPVQENMKIFTHSNKTKNAQKNTMEFLLINHPLDCPICDQGGECELQDVSIQHGESHSNYLEFKRVVIDKDVGPLISTEMTRCIHCSRCVRFGEEVSNNKELGLVNRGEHMEIRTFIEEGISSELSGNMIDLCPVGALNNKPYRYRARTWDLQQHGAISPHDCIGSNIYYHTYNNEIVRAVPKENHDINQTWLSDRDRFGYEGIYAEDRATKPMIRDNKKLVECEKEILLNKTNEIIKSTIDDFGLDQIGCLISAQSTSEELFLFQHLFKHMNIQNIDHRTNESDFNYQENYPLMPSLGCNINDLDKFDNILLVGVNIKTEFPILTIRFNEASKNNTKIFSIHFDSLDEDFKLAGKIVLNNSDLSKFFDKNKPTINTNNKTLIIIGPNINYLVNQSQILDSITKYSKSINAQQGYLTDFCNSTSAWLFGNIPHRNFGGQPTNKPGLNVSDMIKSGLSTYVFFNLEPEHDFWNASAVTEALNKSKYNIFFTSYVTPLIERYADVIIPISTFAETDGSFINIEGTYQAYNKIVNPNKNIFEGWSILNSLIKMNNLGDYNISSIRSFLLKSLQNIDFNCSKNKKLKNIDSKPITNNHIYKNTLRHIYASDQIVRRSKSLNLTEQSHNKFIYISSDLGQILNNKDTLEIRENNKNYKVKNFLIKKELPINTIVYTSSFNNTLNESKSDRITIKS